MSVNGPSSAKYNVLQWQVDGKINEIASVNTAAEAKHVIKQAAASQNVPLDNFAYAKADPQAKNLESEFASGTHVGNDSAKLAQQSAGEITPAADSSGIGPSSSTVSWGSNSGSVANNS